VKPRQVVRTEETKVGRGEGWQEKLRGEMVVGLYSAEGGQAQKQQLLKWVQLNWSFNV
jgi:hypothetical protein